MISRVHSFVLRGIDAAVRESIRPPSGNGIPAVEEYLIAGEIAPDDSATQRRELER